MQNYELLIELGKARIQCFKEDFLILLKSLCRQNIF